MVSILDSDIKFLPGVGPKRGEALSKELNINTFYDLLQLFPFRYIDRTKIYTTSEIEPTMSYIQLRGTIISLTVIGGKSRSRRLIATLQDATGRIDLIFFRQIAKIEKWLKRGSEYIVFGKPTLFNNSLNIVHPEIELASEQTPIYVGNLLGVYPSTERLKNVGLSNKQMALLIERALKQCKPALQEIIPESIVKEKQLLSYSESLFNIHFPKDLATLSRAQYRLKFQELFLLQLSLLKQKGLREVKIPGIPLPRVGDHFNRCYESLPFELTGAQKRVIKEIRGDLISGRQMNRLLQGDVGSGKTMVAIFAALLAADNGYQTCLMAPTEVLATQHYKGTTALLESGGVKSALLTGSTKKRDRLKIEEGLLSGEIGVLFGTHALIEEWVQFKKLGLAIIDEQHRFGVEQRAKLWRKGDEVPHILVMTATPIPRTLAMTLYGDLEVSIIDELPPGRKPVKTIHMMESKRDKVYQFMREEIDKGRQVFVVYPLIKESETLDYQNLQEGYLNIIDNFEAPKYITAVVHGQQKAEDKAHDMELFASGRANILVSTSVIEVGVDVPNASVMVIESAERFGLSQLHQLRGRVGRGTDHSYCILMTGFKLSRESRARIELMCSTGDGFKLAEADLKMRGPGSFEGTQQSGLPIELRLSNLSTDGAILSEARESAIEILKEDLLLEKPQNRVLRVALNRIKRESKDYSLIS